MIYPTQHAKKQAKKRFGWDDKELINNMLNAWDKGDEIPEELISIYFNRTKDTPPDTKIMFYKDTIFIFGLSKKIPRLVTIFPSRSKQKTSYY